MDEVVALPQLNQQYIKANNLKTLFQMIQKNEDISRVELARKAGLSKATVSSLIDELITNEFVVDCGISSRPSAGRKPNRLSVNPSGSYTAVFHFHRNWLSAALVNLKSEVVFELRINRTTGLNYVENAVSLFENELLTREKNIRILGVCVIVPAIIDPSSRKIVSTVLVDALPENAIDQLMKGFGGYPLIILNDTSCYAYAECRYNRMESEYFAFVNLGQGVGAVMIDHGKLFRCANGMTTQFGHFSIARNGELCSCGSRGCLERMIGEAWLFDRAGKEGLRNIFANKSEADFQTLKARADQGDAEAVSLIRTLAADAAYAIGNLISLFNPDEVVIGGGGTVLGQLFLDALSESIHHAGFPLFVGATGIRFTSLDKSSVIRGAEQYFIDQYYSFDRKYQETFIIG